MTTDDNPIVGQTREFLDATFLPHAAPPTFCTGVRFSLTLSYFPFEVEVPRLVGVLVAADFDDDDPDLAPIRATRRYPFGPFAGLATVQRGHRTIIRATLPKVPAGIGATIFGVLDAERWLAYTAGRLDRSDVVGIMGTQPWEF